MKMILILKAAVYAAGLLFFILFGLLALLTMQLVRSLTLSLLPKSSSYAN